CTTEDYW
nr:immunoglobulin heavy chain junction region [Macaca mulatta]MPN84290.1 immunoglobulin heavy chain junction region [Macaca mulatta]MPN84341.1 immunoglobulin heavy chain junction region [Macaca mulatta]MPN84507.1 immunoglobulin heavy chain junction region [Macaca mulatta]MPN84825.1 immunoglobulin heavy chain junction region [Macaca mulatta]